MILRVLILMGKSIWNTARHRSTSHICFKASYQQKLYYFLI